MLKLFLRSKVLLKNTQRENYHNVIKMFSTDKSDSTNKKEIFILKSQPKREETKQKQTQTAQPVMSNTKVQLKTERVITLKSQNQLKSERREGKEMRIKEETTSRGGMIFEKIDLKEEIVQEEKRKSYPLHYTKNSYYSKYVKNLETSAKNYFDKIFNKVQRQLIKNKISQVEKELNEYKENGNDHKDNKIHNVRLESTSAKSGVKSSYEQLNNQEDAAIFNSSSIKEFEAKLAKLNILTLNDFKFKSKILDFYSERNIDKAFEFFYDNMRHDSLDTSNVGNLSHFLKSLLKYDKVEYLRVIYDVLTKNQVKTSALTNPVFNFTTSFAEFLNFHGLISFNYSNALLGLKFMFYHMKNNDKLKTDSKFNSIVNEIFDKVAEIKFKSRKISDNDDILEIIISYTAILNSQSDIEFKINQNSLLLNEESLAKILSLTFDSSNNLNNFDLLQTIFDISHRQENILRYLSDNVLAFYQLFGFVPKILSGKELKTKYHELRHNINKQSESYSINPYQLEFFYILFKLNSLQEYCGDLLRNWNEFVGEAYSKKPSSIKIYERCLSDFILNSEIEKDHHYNKNVDKVFKERNKLANVQSNVDYLVAKTLSYMKDGNNDFAVEDFLKNIEANVKNSKDSDRELVNFYNQMFNEKESGEVQTEVDHDVEFEYTLRKVNMLEKLKEHVVYLFSYLNDNVTDHKFKTKESFAELFKNPNVDRKEADSYLRKKLMNQIIKDLNDLKNLTVDSIKSELEAKKTEDKKINNNEDLETVYAKIKVELYLDDTKYQLLSNILNVNILHVSDIYNMELNEKDKKSLIENIERNIQQVQDRDYSNFAKLVLRFFKLKPVSFKSIKFVSEEDIYKKSSKTMSVDANVPLNIKNLKSEFLKEILKSQPKLEQIIPQYNTLLRNQPNKGASPHVISPKIQSAIEALLITNNVFNMDNLKMFNNINKNIARIVDRASFYKLITLNHIKNNRQRNIIKALHNRRTKIPQTASTAVYVSDLTVERNLQKFKSASTNSSLLKTLYEIQNLTVTRKDNLYIDSIIEELLKLNNVQLNNFDKNKEVMTKKSVSNLGKIEKMKELLNQEYEIFSPKHAIYMVLYGIENNLPYAIRLAEKVCSNLGYVLPTWVELRLNKYLLTNSKEYAATVKKIAKVNVANVYRSDLSKDKIYDERGIGSLNDNNKAGSIFAVDYLPFNGLEQIVDLKKFTMIMKDVSVKF